MVCVLAAALLVGTATTSSAATGSSAVHTAKKKCKRGYVLRTVKRHGKRVKVCKKKPRHSTTTTTTQPTTTTTPQDGPTTPTQPSGPQGPSVAEVEQIIRAQLQAGAPAYLGPSAVEVIFEQPTQVLPQTQWDTDGPNNSTGVTDAFPVRAWVKSITHRDSTPDDDTRYFGCDGHLDHTWPHDSLYYFYPSPAGGWTFKTDVPGTIGC
jgi:hypothetical protein